MALSDYDAQYANLQALNNPNSGWNQAFIQQQMQSVVAARDAEAARIAAENDAWHRANGTGIYATTSSNPAPTSYSPSPPPPPPQPLLPTFKPMTGSKDNVLVAPSDTIQFDDSTVEVARMQDLLFEDIGAVELANISRSDLIDGQETIYAPIKNLSSVRKEFNPNTIVATSYNADYFTRFGIDINSRGIKEPYFDSNGDLVIEIDTVLEDEEIQVQVLANGTIDLIEET